MTERTDRDKRDEGIDYEAEGATPPRDEETIDDTDRGYDEAAHSGPSVYDRNTGDGGVFGTTGGGTSPGGMHVDEESER